ncbi:MAG: Na+/H+ antiporter NhaA [Oligoflexia bacterium]|nr:Na+/H+ antiporter NhaA [Oligoflexia bacterium]
MKVVTFFQKFLQTEAASGVLLVFTAALALLLANSSAAPAYFNFLAYRIVLPAGLDLPVLHWINDALMAIFFLLVGLEIKRELIQGELSSARKAALPAAAALGGMIFPALIFTGINWGSPAVHGWAIPTATDIAFSLGIISLLGNRVPLALKVFLTALAIVDDLGAVAVIALFYTSKLDLVSLGWAVLLTTALIAANRRGFRKISIYLLAGLPLWYLVHHSGIHATVAGVVLAFCIPREIGEQIEKTIHPWVAYLIMPIFALANAGVQISGGLAEAISHPVGIGVLLGLFFGKQLGITIFSWLAAKLNVAELPAGVDFKGLYGAACLGGIGFTMSIFIATLSYEGNHLLDVAKLGILAGSLISAFLGLLVLLLRFPRPGKS